MQLTIGTCRWTRPEPHQYNQIMKTSTSGKFKLRPVARRTLRPRVSSAHLIGSLRGKIRITGDLNGTGRKWHAQS